MSSETVFRYSYSAKQNEEVQAIRSRYLPHEESKLDELRRLDHQVCSAGMIPALCLGIIGCLAFGLGLCLAMKVIGHSIALGVVLGILGTTAMVMAYPIYRACFRKTKTKCQSRIMELIDELSNAPT